MTNQLTFPEIFPIYPLLIILIISLIILFPAYAFTLLWAAGMFGFVLFCALDAHRASRS